MLINDIQSSGLNKSTSFPWQLLSSNKPSAITGAANICFMVVPYIRHYHVHYLVWEQNSPLSAPKPPPELRLPPHSLGRSMAVRIRRGNALAGAKPLPIVCSVELLAGWLTFSCITLYNYADAYSRIQTKQK